MPISTSGRVEASNINTEFGRYYRSYMSIWHARNGYYGAVNRSRDRNPLGVGQTNSGYAYSDWRGYDHRASSAHIQLQQRESRNDVDTRITWYHWNQQYIGQRWEWGTINRYYPNSWLGFEPYGRRYDIYFDNGISWGSAWNYNYRRIYSNRRGYLLNVYERANTYRNYSGLYTQSNEFIRIDNLS